MTLAGFQTEFLFLVWKQNYIIISWYSFQVGHQNGRKWEVQKNLYQILECKEIDVHINTSKTKKRLSYLLPASRGSNVMTLTPSCAI